MRAKIDQRARSDVEKYRYAYFLFGRPEGHVEYDIFRDRVRAMGIPARDDQLRELFDRYDEDHDGKIDFYEMIRNILPKDYPQKVWGAKRQEEMLIKEYEALIGGKSKEKKMVPNLTLAPDTARSNRNELTMSKFPDRTYKNSAALQSSRNRAKKSSSPYLVSARSNRSQQYTSRSGRPMSRQLASRMNAIARMRHGTPRQVA